MNFGPSKFGMAPPLSKLSAVPSLACICFGLCYTPPPPPVYSIRQQHRLTFSLALVILLDCDLTGWWSRFSSVPWHPRSSQRSLLSLRKRPGQVEPRQSLLLRTRHYHANYFSPLELVLLQYAMFTISGIVLFGRCPVDDLALAAQCLSSFRLWLSGSWTNTFRAEMLLAPLAPLAGRCITAACANLPLGTHCDLWACHYAACGLLRSFLETSRL